MKTLSQQSVRCSRRTMPLSSGLCSSRCAPRHIASSSSSTSTTAVTEVPSRTATVQVDLGYAAEQTVVRLTHPNSRLVEATMQFPLGLVLESVNGEVVVTELTEGSSAAAANCRVGDVVRATTAFTMQMTYPTMNIMFGGVGRPKLTKILLPTDKVPFRKVMDAVRSNTAAQGGDNSVTLVLERIDDDSGRGSSNGDGSTGSSSNGDDGAAAAAGAENGAAEEALFDPRIFKSTFE